MTEEEFEKKFGRKPIQDDLDRVNCKDAGKPGHYYCGVCTKHNKPKFECIGCMKTEH